MEVRGHFQNGVIVLDEPVSVPEGTTVKVEFVEPNVAKSKRQGGMWKGRVVIADDFDTLPPDLADAFGVGIE